MSRPTIRSLLAEGKTPDEVVTLLGVRRHSVHAVRYQCGLAKFNGRRNPEKEAECVRLVNEGKLTVRAISQRLRLSPTTVRSIRKAHGLPIGEHGKWKAMPDMGRCACGLLKPCDCDGMERSAVAFATSRGEDGPCVMRLPRG